MFPPNSKIYYKAGDISMRDSEARSGMIPGRILLLALALPLVTSSAASAQMAPAPGQAPPCTKDFIPLRKEAEERSALIRVAVEKKDRDAACQAFKNFAISEEKVVKFLQTNQVWCGIPPQMVKQVKENHAKTLKTRNQVCNAAALPAAAAARPPSLSDALNAPPPPSAPQTGRGTFDTLTGNPLTR